MSVVRCPLLQEQKALGKRVIFIYSILYAHMTAKPSDVKHNDLIDAMRPLVRAPVQGRGTP